MRACNAVIHNLRCWERRGRRPWALLVAAGTGLVREVGALLMQLSHPPGGFDSPHTFVLDVLNGRVTKVGGSLVVQEWTVSADIAD